MESLDFLDAFPDELLISLCGLKVHCDVDYNKLSRFVEGEFDDLEDSHYVYLKSLKKS